MKIIFCTSFLSETVEVEVENLAQVIDYIENNKNNLIQELDNSSCCWALIDSFCIQEAVVLTPHIVQSSFEGFDTLLIYENIEGEGIFTTIAGIIATSVFGATSLAAASLGVAIASYAISAVIVFGLMYGLKSLMSMMTPNQDLNAGDGATQRKNLMLNGIPNVDEQGGALPVVIGECFFGGVKVGQNVSTVDIDVSGGGDVDLDKNIPEISKNTIKDRGDGHWYRVQ